MELARPFERSRSSLVPSSVHVLMTAPSIVNRQSIRPLLLLPPHILSAAVDLAAIAIQLQRWIRDKVSVAPLLRPLGTGIENGSCDQGCNGCGVEFWWEWEFSKQELLPS